MHHLGIFILAIRRIERDRGRNRAIFQTNPRLDFIVHSLLIQEDLTCAASRVAISSIPSMPTVAHVDSIPSQVLINGVAVPLETPDEVSNGLTVSTPAPGKHIPIVLVVVTAKGSHQAGGIQKCLHEPAILSRVGGVHRALRHHTLAVDSGGSMRVEAVLLVLKHSVGGNMEECERRNGTVILGGQVLFCFREPIDNLA